MFYLYPLPLLVVSCLLWGKYQCLEGQAKRAQKSKNLSDIRLSPIHKKKNPPVNSFDSGSPSKLLATSSTRLLSVGSATASPTTSNTKID